MIGVGLDLWALTQSRGGGQAPAISVNDGTITATGGQPGAPIVTVNDGTLTAQEAT